MKTSICFLLILLHLSCAPSGKEVSATAILISDVNVIDVRDSKVLGPRQVVIDSGKITRVSASIEHPEAYTTRIDGSGKYLLPGLAEMHAHIPSPPSSQERVEETLFLYLSNGITTIRGMLGHPSHLSLREKVASGEILGPRIFTSSPSLNGNSMSTVADARTSIPAYKNEGYDFLKIHPGIKREVFDVIVSTADSAGITFSGHVPVDVGIRHALNSQYASIDHVDGYLEGLVPDDADVAPEDNGFFGYNFTALADTSGIEELVELTAEHEVWVVPTQSLFERWFAPVSAEDLLRQPEMKYMPEASLEDWGQRKEETTGPESGFDAGQWEKFITIRRQLIKALHDKGHGLLLGSDAPQLFNVPGFSIHHEIEGMRVAGLSPGEILRSGTLNPAIFFDQEDTFGEIKEGLEADLILVSGNPLENLAALRNISGVMVRGKWLPAETIAERLEQIATRASSGN